MPSRTPLKGTLPRIAITAAALGPDRVAMNVADNGQGIAPELLPRIFDLFVTTRMGRGGTGLVCTSCTTWCSAPWAVA